MDNTYQEEHQTLTIRADEFSTYAIAYTQETEKQQERYRLNMTQVLSGKEDGCDLGHAYSNMAKRRLGISITNGRYDWYYFFDPKGYMKDGWIEIGGKWYYLHKLYDGRRGYMYTGLRQIDGKSISSAATVLCSPADGRMWTDTGGILTLTVPWQ